MENQYNFNDPQSYVPLLASAIVGAATLTVIQMLTGNSDKNPDGNAKNIIPSSKKSSSSENNNNSNDDDGKSRMVNKYRNA